MRSWSNMCFLHCQQKIFLTTEWIFINLSLPEFWINVHNRLHFDTGKVLWFFYGPNVSGVDTTLELYQFKMAVTKSILHTITVKYQLYYNTM